MKSFAKKTLNWALMISVSSWAIAHAQFHADPTDDFSFLYANSGKHAQRYSLMSEREVSVILVDRIQSLPRSEATQVARHLIKLCRAYRFDPAFILSMMEVESGFRIKIESPAGAIGLMQIMPATAEVVAKRFGIRYTGARSLKDPYTNISLGIAYLYYLRTRYQGESPYFHVAAYNLGPAKLNELRSQKTFKPINTKIYYETIKNGVPRLRFYNAGFPLKSGTKGSVGV